MCHKLSIDELLDLEFERLEHDLEPFIIPVDDELIGAELDDDIEDHDFDDDDLDHDDLICPACQSDFIARNDGGLQCQDCGCWWEA